ncbi:effector-associated constant component EACC1 [Paractinoplanes maris]|uniref:effector-associated constant component EACC1 n=1 Tax=Paractinoplanes maris TaxID=1734446 RepID=UPI0020206603|nr:hypothetical protein [Actinoplanes maris]
MTELVVTIASSDGSSQQEALGEWLRAEDALRGRVRIATPPPTSGSMGALSDGIVVAVGSGGLLTVLVSSLVSWVTRDRSKPSIDNAPSITITLPDGIVIRIDGQGSTNPSEIEAARVSLDRNGQQNDQI